MATLHPLQRPLAVALTALLLVQVTGCTKWRVVETPTPESLARDEPSGYRIMLHGGEVRVVEQLQLVGDSLVGLREQRGADRLILQREAHALADVTSVEARVNNGVVTGLLVAGVLVGAVALAVGAADDGWSTGGGGLFGGSSGNLSCPLVYSWDGAGYRLDSGTFGGAVMPALTRTDLDHLAFVAPDRGVLRFLMTAEQPETEYVDAFSVVAIDHPAGTAVIPDGRANGQFLAVRDIALPLVVRDLEDRDVTPAIREADGREWTTALADRDPANRGERRDGITATFARPAGDTVVLVVDGRNTNWSAFLLGELVQRHGRATAAWYDPASSPAMAAGMRATQARHGSLTISLWHEGAWQPVGAIWEAGPEVSKQQALAIPITDLAGDTVRIRLESAPAFWSIDRVVLGSPSHARVAIRELAVTRAIDDRGEDRTVDLEAIDRRYLVMERGDSVRIEVSDARQAPAAGTERSYLLRTNGWYRVHGRDQADPDAALLARLSEPDGPAIVSIEWFNAALAALRTGISGHD